MNYAEMSDEEINTLVIDYLIQKGIFTSDPTEVSYRDYVSNGWNWGRGNETHLMRNGKPFIAHNNGIKLNYCNSWCHAGPIIQDNYLSIECDDIFDEPTPQSYWKAHNPHGNHYTDTNPLRAAMIVFLMMQESK